MVKVKAFSGAVFLPEDYSSLLKNNIQHLEAVPMSKTFNTSQMIANGNLWPESAPFLYVYRQIYRGQISFGLLAQISIQDYQDNKIKKHEETLYRPHLNHETYRREHVGPIVLSYREHLQLGSLIQNIAEQQAPFSSWKTVDGRDHTLWRISKEKNLLQSKFKEVKSLYILDGHHRMQAALQNYILSDKSSQKDKWIQALLYSSENVVIHPMHRIISKAPSNMNILEKILKLQELDIASIPHKEEAIDIKQELKTYEIVLKENGSYYGINFKDASRNILEKVSSVRLQREIFDQILDETQLKDIKYLPGIIDERTISKHDVVFFVRQPKIQTLFQIADENVAMPPKSTWIEPKPCSHMVIRFDPEKLEDHS